MNEIFALAETIVKDGRHSGADGTLTLLLKRLTISLGRRPALLRDEFVVCSRQSRWEQTNKDGRKHAAA
jgi:hypothetical protein